MKTKSFFLDENHNLAPPKQARFLVTVTTNQKGEVVHEVWADLKKPKSEV